LAANRSRIEKIVGTVSFVVIAAVFLFVSQRAGVQAIGVSFLVGAAYGLRADGIPYGWEGQEPSGYLRGIWQVLFYAACAAIGVALLAMPDLALSLANQ
jgi:hypothetical protein